MNTAEDYAKLCEAVYTIARLEIEQIKRDGEFPVEVDAALSRVDEVISRVIIRNLFPRATEIESETLRGFEMARRAYTMAVNTKPRTPEWEQLTASCERIYCEGRELARQVFPADELTPLQKHFIETELLHIPFEE